MANALMRRKQKIAEPFSDKVLDVITSAVLLCLLIVVGYPVVFTISASISDANALNNGQVFLWPVGLSLNGYGYVLQFKQFYVAFRNSVFYTAAGALIQLCLKIMLAYPISRPNFQGRRVYSKILVATMLVNAGMIPLFIIKTKLGLYNNIWAFLFTGGLSTSDVFILRTAFRSTVPGELYDAASIDGASEFQMLWKIALPLCKATLSVITLYTIVGYWNNYMTPLIYLRDEELKPLSLFLRDVLQSASFTGEEGVNVEQANAINRGLVQMKYAIIVISTVPVLAAYFVVQGYFKTGVMIGSVKG